MKKLISKSFFLYFIGLIFICTIFISCNSTKASTFEVPQDSSKPNVPYSVSFAEKLRECLKTGTVEDALELFNKVPKKYENDLDIQFLHASLLVSAGRLEEAGILTDKLLEIDKNNQIEKMKKEGLDPTKTKINQNQDLLMLAATIAKASGNKTKKTTLLKEILEKDPTNPEANVELAQEQMLNKNYKLAKNYYSKGLEGDSDNEDALTGYGQASYYTGDDKESKEAFNKILEKNPENSFAYYYLGKLAAEENNYLQATEYIEKAIKLDNDIFDYWMDYGQYLRYRGKFKEAEKAWLTAKDLETDYFLSYAYLAGLYDEQNRFADALKMYKKVVELNPKYYFAYESLGMFAWHEKDYINARLAFEKAYSMKAENISYPLMIAATYLKENNIPEAKKFLSKALRNKSPTSVEYAMLRLYFDRLNDMQVAQKVLNTTDRNLKGKMLYYLGLFYEINGNDVMAEKYYTEVVNLESPMFFEFRLAEWAVAERQQ